MPAVMRNRNQSMSGKKETENVTGSVTEVVVGVGTGAEVGTGRILPVKFWVGGSVDPSDRLLRSAVAGIVGHFVLPGSSPHPGHSLTLSPHCNTSLGLSGGRVSGHNVLRLRHYRHHLQPGSVSSSPGSQHRGPHDRAGAAGGHGEAG